MWLILAFCSAALLGFYDVFKKLSLRDNAVIPVLWANTLLCALFFVPLIVGSAIGVLTPGCTGYIPVYGWAEHRFILLKSLLVLSSWMLGYFGIKHLPLTVAGPINATRPVMTLVGALLIFGERLNGWQWAGVWFSVVSFFLLSRSSRKEGIRFAHNGWVACVMAAAVLGAASGLYDKFLMTMAGPDGGGLDKLAVQGWYNVYQCAMMFVVLLVAWRPLRRRTAPFRWRWSIVFISVFLTLADLAYFYALSQPGAMVAVVSMVRRSSVVVSFLCGAMLFHERNLRAKAFDLALVLLGMVCIWLGTARG